MINNKLHILFLCGWYPSRVLPANGDFIQRHAEAVATKHKVSVLHIISDSSLTQSRELSTNTLHNVTTHIAYVKPSNNPLVKMARFFSAFKVLLSKIDSYDIVHVNKLFPFGIFAIFLKKFRKVPYIISEHWTGYHFPQANTISRMEVFLSKKIAKHASFVCPVSRDLQGAMENIGLKGNYEIVPNVVAVEKFKPFYETSRGVFTMVHISNMLDVHKNVSGILQTIALLKNKIPDFRLYLIGENSLKYKGLTTTLNVEDKVVFVDHVSHDKVVAYLQKADLLVMFSNYENLPCIILESFACGTPVVSTDVGGISEFFPKDFGFLVSPKDTDQLLESLLKVYYQPINQKEKMHQYAIENFSKESIVDIFTRLYIKSLV